MAGVGAIGGLLTLFAITPSKGEKGESGTKRLSGQIPQIWPQRAR
jgi:MFS transporter, ACDE family, multidrug resistance protein